VEALGERGGIALAPEKDPRYPLNRRLGSPQNRSEHRPRGKNPFASAGDRTLIARSCRAILAADVVLLEL
jgi:hypothetical protein